MRIITLLVILIGTTPAHAKIYKCEIEGKISFQQTPCQAKATSSEFILKKDISIERQQLATQKLDDDLTKLAEKKRLAQKIAAKERLIRAEENKAWATYQNAQANQEQAYQTARQTKAIEKRNDLLRSPYIYQKVPLNAIPLK